MRLPENTGIPPSLPRMLKRGGSFERNRFAPNEGFTLTVKSRCACTGAPKMARAAAVMSSTCDVRIVIHPLGAPQQCRTFDRKKLRDRSIALIVPDGELSAYCFRAD